MAALRAFRCVRNVSHASAISPVLFRHVSQATVTPQPFIQQAQTPAAKRKPVKKPRRKWMSVADLVEEVESALAKGILLDKDGPTYNNLDQELHCVRADNDNLNKQLLALKETRAKHVAEEARAVIKQDASSANLITRAILMQDDCDIIGDDILNTVVDATKKIQTIDYELAALNNQKKHNVADVGQLKLAKSRIEIDGSVMGLLNRIEEALHAGEILAVDGPEAKYLKEVIERLQGEYAKVSPKVKLYGKNRKDLAIEMEVLENEVEQKMGEDSMERGRAQEVDMLRYHLTQKVQQDQRMLAQLGRLRQLQKMNVDYICRLERAQAKLRRYAKVHRVIESGDVDQMQDKMFTLNEDLVGLRTSTKEIECLLDSHVEEGLDIMNALRKMKDAYSSDAGRQRQLLLANIHQEEQWKTRLAVLRGEKIQKLRLLTLLQAALP